MKRAIELTKREKFLLKLFSNNHGCIVENERLVYDYFYMKVTEYIWILDITKLCITKLKNEIKRVSGFRVQR